MKLGILTSLSLALVALVAGCAQESSSDEASASSAQDLVSATSAYTETSRVASLDACKLTHQAGAEMDYRGDRYDCGEMGGYTLIAQKYVQSGTDAYLRTPTGTYSIDVNSGILSVGGSLNVGYFGKLAEWRGRGIKSATPAEPYSGRVEPTALIMRYFFSADSSLSHAQTFHDQNALFVIKLTPEGACVHSTVSGATANHNQIARDIADSQAFKDFTCPVTTPEPLPPTSCGTLNANNGLWIAESVSSCSGSHTLVMQTDRNLVLYNNRTGRATWNSHTVGSVGYAAIMRPNGQFGIFAETLRPTFEVPASGGEGAFLAVQDDGNVVVYAKDGHPVWSTGTQGK